MLGIKRNAKRNSAGPIKPAVTVVNNVEVEYTVEVAVTVETVVVVVARIVEVEY